MRISTIPVPVGSYAEDDGDCVLEVFASDEGARITLFDRALGVRYTFVLDENARIGGFDIELSD